MDEIETMDEKTLLKLAYSTGQKRAADVQAWMDRGGLDVCEVHVDEAVAADNALLKRIDARLDVLRRTVDAGESIDFGPVEQFKNGPTRDTSWRFVWGCENDE